MVIYIRELAAKYAELIFTKFYVKLIIEEKTWRSASVVRK